MSKSILTGKTFKHLGEDNEKLGNLGGQMDEMRSDFIEMKRTRDEAKKQLEAKFQDVYRKIQLTQDFITSEGKRINDTLIAFSSKFEHRLDTFDQKLSGRVDTLQHQCDTRFGEDRDRLTNLEKGLAEEEKERIRSIAESNKSIGDQLAALKDGLDQERATREKREKEMERRVSDLAYSLGEKLELESQERRSNGLLLKQQTEHAVESQRKLSEGFHKKSVDEFNLLVDNVIKEVDNRFNHQDSIVDNLSHVVKTIQDTLKVIGSDV